MRIVNEICEVIADIIIKNNFDIFDGEKLESFSLYGCQDGDTSMMAMFFPSDMINVTIPNQTLNNLIGKKYQSAENEVIKLISDSMEEEKHMAKNNE